MSDDFETDDIFDDGGRKKGPKGKPKGKRGELEITKVFNDRFVTFLDAHPQGGKFSRSVGSGNRWGQGVALSKNAQNTFSGDITCPDNFKFVLESKIGYSHIDLLLFRENKEIDKFIEQVSADSARCGREPMLLWRKDRKPRLVFLRESVLKDYKFSYYLKYKEWIVVLLDDLLALKDDFFFENG